MALTGSNVSNKLRSDEIPRGLGFAGDKLKYSGAYDGSGGTVPYPIPYFGPSGTDYWPIEPSDDGDEKGLRCTARFRIPTGTIWLLVEYRKVKKNGTYGPLKQFKRFHVSDIESANQFCEVELKGLPANSRIDLVRLTARIGTKKKLSDRKINPPNNMIPDTGATPVVATNPTPSTPQGFPVTASSPTPLPLAHVVTGDWIDGHVRIVSVGTPQAEPDGVYYPVNVTFTPNVVRRIAFGVARVGAQVRISGESVAQGKYDVGRYAGQGSIAFSTATEAQKIAAVKHRHFPGRDLTDEETTAGSATILLGPFNEKQAKKSWHIRRIRWRAAWDDDSSKSKVVRQKYPAVGAEADLASSPTDASPVNEGPAGAAYLAVLNETEIVTDAPGDPNASLIVYNQADHDTDKHGDVLIRVKIPVSQSDPTKTAADTNVDELVAVFMSEENYTTHSGNLFSDAAKETWHISEPYSCAPTDTFGICQIHRQAARQMRWIFNRARNGVSHKNSTGAAVAFKAGGKSNSHTAITDHNGNNFLYCFDDWTSDSETGTRHKHVTVGWNNSATAPAIPKKIHVWVNKVASGDPGSAIPEAIGRNDVSGPWRYLKDVDILDEEEYAASGDLHANGDPDPEDRVAFKRVINCNVKQGEIRYFIFGMKVIGSSTIVYSQKVDNTPGNDTGGGISDAAAPSWSVATAPTMRFKHGHFRARIAPPDVDNLTIVDNGAYEWQFCNSSTFTGNTVRLFLQDNDTTPFVAPASGSEPSIKGNFKLSVPLKRRDFKAAGFADGDTIFSRVRVTNSIGTSSYSSTGSLAMSSIENDSDTIPDAAAVAPTFKHATIGSAGIDIAFRRPVDGRKIVRYDFALTTSSVSGSGNAIDPYAGTSPGAIGALPANDTGLNSLFFEAVGNRLRTKTRYAKLRKNISATYGGTHPADGATLTNLFVFARVVDSDSTGALRYGAWSSTGTAFTFEAGGLDKGSGSDPANENKGRHNRISGGGMYQSQVEFGSGNSTDLGRGFFTTLPTTGDYSSAVRVNDTVSASLPYWDKTNHCIVIPAGGSRTFYVRVSGAMIPNEHYSHYFLAASQSGSPSVAGSVQLVDHTGSAKSSAASGTLDVDSTTYTPFAGTFSVTGTFTRSAGSANAVGDAYLKFTFTAPASNNLYIDNLTFVRGDEPRVFELSADDEIATRAIGAGVTTTNFKGIGSVAQTGGYGKSSPDGTVIALNAIGILDV